MYAMQQLVSGEGTITDMYDIFILYMQDFPSNSKDKHTFPRLRIGKKLSDLESQTSQSLNLRSAKTRESSAEGQRKLQRDTGFYAKRTQLVLCFTTVG